MDLSDRIRRRQQSGTAPRVVVDFHAISPAAHVEEPTGRGSVIERLLDYVDPVFGGRIPPNAYVWGPPGSGKSAVITALFNCLRQSRFLSNTLIHTATRAKSSTAPELVYLDARDATTEFQRYQTILDAVVDDPVPEHGVGTATLRSRLDEYLVPHNHSVLVAIDHVGEPGTSGLAEMANSFAPLGGSLSWVAVGRTPPSDLPPGVRPPERIEVPAYRESALVDVLTARAADGLAHGAIEHEQLRRIATWSEGNAHDALCVLFTAADEARLAEASRIREADLHAGMDAVPRSATPIGRVLALSENRQAVLRRLLECDEDHRQSVADAAASIAGRIDLSAGTVKRLLYELASDDIVERIPTNGIPDRKGRAPSRVEPRFPTHVFGRLYDTTRRDN